MQLADEDHRRYGGDQDSIDRTLHSRKPDCGVSIAGGGGDNHDDDFSRSTILWITSMHGGIQGADWMSPGSKGVAGRCNQTFLPKTRFFYFRFRQTPFRGLEYPEAAGPFALHTTSSQSALLQIPRDIMGESLETRLWRGIASQIASQR